MSPRATAEEEDGYSNVSELNRLSIGDRQDVKETKANIPSVREAKGFLSRIVAKYHSEISSSGNP